MHLYMEQLFALHMRKNINFIILQSFNSIRNSTFSVSLDDHDDETAKLVKQNKFIFILGNYLVFVNHAA